MQGFGEDGATPDSPRVVNGRRHGVFPLGFLLVGGGEAQARTEYSKAKRRRLPELPLDDEERARAENQQRKRLLLPKSRSRHQAEKSANGNAQQQEPEAKNHPALFDHARPFPFGEQKAALLKLANEDDKRRQLAKWRVLKEGDIERAKMPGWRPQLAGGGEVFGYNGQVVERTDLPGTPGWVPRLTPTRRGDELFLSVQ